jgi:holo-[acyl-carrier protein] synthase
MTILGTGVDAVETPRIAKMLERWGDRFPQRAFTEQERAYCDRKKRGRAECYAARWAAKEAAFKALGGGPGTKRWRDYEVLRDAAGRPSIVLSGAAQTAAEKLGVERLHLSLTHDGGVAVAFVVLEGG